MTRVPIKHDFHVSITVAEWRAEKGDLEIYIKVFSDDIMQAVPENTKGELEIKDYLASRFYFEREGERIMPEYIGMEEESELTFLYLVVKGFNPTKNIYVHNTVLFDQFDDQSNIVNLSINREIRSAFLSRTKPGDMLNFNTP